MGTRIPKGIGLIVLALCVPIFVYASETITSFTSDIALHKDGSFDVEERITYDFGDAEKHGMFREIPLTHTQKASTWYKKRYIDVAVGKVTLDGAPVPFKVTRSSDTMRIKIGDPKRTVTGTHTYAISYTVNGGLTYTDTHPDFYWNVTGNKWPVAIQNVLVTLRGPTGSFRAHRSCYKGYQGSVEPCDAIEVGFDNVTFAAKNLSQGQGVTVAQELNASVIGYQAVENISWIFVAIPLWILLFLFLLYKIYRFRTAHNPHATIIPQYEPYPDVLPMFSGVLIDGKLDPRDITAGLIHLAQSGFLKIRKIENKKFHLIPTTDYEITLLRPIEEASTSFERQILTLLFSNDEAGQTVTLGNLRKDFTKKRENRDILQSLKLSVLDDLERRGFYEGFFYLPKIHLWIGVALSLLASFLFYRALDVQAVIILVLLLFAFGTITVTFVRRRRTKKGYEARNHLKGFKEFLSVTDKERFAFHNAPEKSPEQFMQYLAYAIALGVEDKWAKAFNDIPLQNPEWYEGNVGTMFAASDFARDVSSFSHSFNAASGASASSGGGSVGGGTGGGGGGSW